MSELATNKDMFRRTARTASCLGNCSIGLLLLSTLSNSSGSAQQLQRFTDISYGGRTHSGASNAVLLRLFSGYSQPQPFSEALIHHCGLGSSILGWTPALCVAGHKAGLTAVSILPCTPYLFTCTSFQKQQS